jgi:hypothetical protein
MLYIVGGRFGIAGILLAIVAFLFTNYREFPGVLLMLLAGVLFVQGQFITLSFGKY